MKNSFFVYYTLPLAFLLWSCNNRSADSEKKAKEANSERIDSQIMNNKSSDSVSVVLSQADADFVVEAASGGMMEVQLGQLAQTNSRNQQVKDFGALMVKDHGGGGAQIKALAASKKITLPDSISNSQQKEKDRLGKKKGDEFDRAYVNAMLSDHKKDIREFQRAAKNATDSDIKSFAAANLPMLYAHLDSVQQLQKRLGIKEIPVGPPPYE